MEVMEGIAHIYSLRLLLLCKIWPPTKRSPQKWRPSDPPWPASCPAGWSSVNLFWKRLVLTKNALVLEKLWAAIWNRSSLDVKQELKRSVHPKCCKKQLLLHNVADSLQIATKNHLGDETIVKNNTKSTTSQTICKKQCKISVHGSTIVNSSNNTSSFSNHGACEAGRWKMSHMQPEFIYSNNGHCKHYETLEKPRNCLPMMCSEAPCGPTSSYTSFCGSLHCDLQQYQCFARFDWCFSKRRSQNALRFETRRFENARVRFEHARVEDAKIYIYIERERERERWPSQVTCGCHLYLKMPSPPS